MRPQDYGQNICFLYIFLSPFFTNKTWSKISIASYEFDNVAFICNEIRKNNFCCPYFMY